MVTSMELQANQERYRLQLEAAQRNAAERRTLEAQTRAIKKPSFFGYMLLFVLAGILDLLDIIELTGVGIIFAKIIQIFATIFFMIISFFVTGKIRRMRKANEVIGARVTAAMQRIAQYRQRYARTLKFARQFKSLRKPARIVATSFKRARTVVNRSPLMKSALLNAAEFIPLIGVIPFQTLDVYFMYRDHKTTFQEAQQALQEGQEVQAEADAQLRQIQEAEIQGLTQYEIQRFTYGFTQ
jgi:hypothetical protein